MKTDEISQPNNYKEALAILLLVIISLFSLLLSIHPLDYEEMVLLGYSGAFVVALLSSVTVILPVPSAVTVLATARVLDPTIVGIIAGTGATLGELSGYFAGCASYIIVGNQSGKISRLEYWMKRFGAVSIVILAFIPNPFFDLTGLIAGHSRYSLLKFMAACWLGKVAKMVSLAHIGASI